MLKHDHSQEGPPCQHMETLLQQTADGSALGLGRWYALAHAARCGRCGRFLARLREALAVLRGAKASEPSAAVLDRLARGEWRKETPATEETRSSSG